MCTVFILVSQQSKSSRERKIAQNKSAYLRNKNTIKELLLKTEMKCFTLKTLKTIFQVKQL